MVHFCLLHVIHIWKAMALSYNLAYQEISSASSSKTKRDIGMGPTGEMVFTYRATNALLTKSGCGAVLTVFCLPEVGRCR